MKTHYIVTVIDNHGQKQRLGIDAEDTFDASKKAQSKYPQSLSYSAKLATRHEVAHLVAETLLRYMHDTGHIKLPKFTARPLSGLVADAYDVIEQGDIPTFEDAYQAVGHFFGVGSGPGSRPHL